MYILGSWVFRVRAAAWRLDVQTVRGAAEAARQTGSDGDGGPQEGEADEQRVAAAGARAQCRRDQTAAARRGGHVSLVFTGRRFCSAIGEDFSRLIAWGRCTGNFGPGRLPRRTCNGEHSDASIGLYRERSRQTGSSHCLCWQTQEEAGPATELRVHIGVWQVPLWQKLI